MSKFIDFTYQKIYRCAYPIMQCYWHFFKQATHGAQVAVFTDDSVLLIRNSYREGYFFPGGHIGKNETAIQAAVRELYEETGLTVSPKDLKKINYISYLRNGVRCSDTIFKYQLTKQPIIKIDNREVSDSRFFKSSELHLLALQDSFHQQISLYQKI